ncbi:hypothetical protein [Xylanibacter ruminicola]|uniref:Uncharacterized protein n=1 Tax=Xylanibacter ruminicola TaxID=839 RepID=A0A1M6Z1L9_XYLRU|nr:hypothetical protein [Xylanibacter ruminicola]SHL24283.1 hypothetical protein SAMN05216463_13715 [Xylanibacter ruminicola]
MKYSIAFRGLPFEPEKRQVIYVENLYDEHINAIIRDIYEQLKWTFKRANLDFIYLPMFFNDEETKEKILYYAPYLTSEIIENAELRNNYLLSYMSNLGNRDKIGPSLIYAPQKEDNEWIFQGQSIDLDEKNKYSFLRLIEDFIADVEEDIESSRQRLHVVLDDEESNDGILYRSDEDWVESEPKAEYSSTPDLGTKLGRWLKKFGHACLEEEEGYPSASSEPPMPSLDEINEEDVRDTIEELERNIERLRLLGIPLAAIAEFVAKYETISKIKFTDDLRIFLPDYNNLEVKMGALYKAVFFLFINHPEGIILKRLEEYHHELTNYYLQASGRDSLTQKMYESINTLEYPGNNYINTILSKIKMCFKATIDEHLAKHYFIVGRPGEPYKITLDKIEIEWEDEE